MAGHRNVMRDKMNYSAPHTEAVHTLLLSEQPDPDLSGPLAGTGPDGRLTGGKLHREAVETLS